MGFSRTAVAIGADSPKVAGVSHAKASGTVSSFNCP